MCIYLCVFVCAWSCARAYKCIYAYVRPRLTYRHFAPRLGMYLFCPLRPSRCCIIAVDLAASVLVCQRMLPEVRLFTLWDHSPEDVGHQQFSLTKRESLLGAECDEAQYCYFPYSVCSMTAVLIYCILVIDLTVLPTRVSAHVLVCQRILSEVGLFMLAPLDVIAMFSSAFCTLDHSPKDYDGIHSGAVTLLRILMKMYGLGCSEGDIGAADGMHNLEPARLSPTVFPMTSATFRRAACSCCVLGCCFDMRRALSGRCFAQPGMSEKSYFRVASACYFHNFRPSQDVYSVGFAGSADLSTQLLAEDEEGDENDHGISSLSCRTLSRTRFVSGR